MNTLFETIKSLGDIRVAISQKDDKMTISLIPDVTGIKDQAVKLLQPLHVTVHKDDTEKDIVDLILNFAPKAVEELNSMKHYQEAIDKMANEKAEAKAKKEDADKLEKKFKEDNALLTKLLSKDESKDESKHTKLFTEFKESYKDLKGFNTVCDDLQKLFNDKYLSLDLFSQM